MLCRAVSVLVAAMAAVCESYPAGFEAGFEANGFEAGLNNKMESVEWHGGLHARPLHRVLASSAQTVTFPVDLRPPPWFKSGALLAKLRELLRQQSPGAAMEGMILNATENFGSAQRRIANHFDEVALRARLERRRRSGNPLHAVSAFLGWCCGFSTHEDVSLLEQRDEVVLQGLAEMGGAVLEAGLAADHNADVLQQVVDQINAALPEIGRQAADAGRRVDEHRDLATHIALLVAGIASQATDTLLHADRLNSIRASCSSGRIPVAAVPREDLRRTVGLVDAHLGGRHRVAVDADLLYKLEVARCVFGVDNMTVVVKLPLAGRAPATALDLTPLSFHYAGQVCSLLPRPVLAVVLGELDVRLMSSEQRALCLARSICEVPRAAESTEFDGADGDCVRGLLAREGLDALRGQCAFACRPDRRVRLTHIENNQYSVVSAERALAVRCPGRAALAVPPQAVGALRVEVPCDCSLEVVDEAEAEAQAGRGAALVRPVQPCDPRLALNVSMALQVPALWAGPGDAGDASLSVLLGDGARASAPAAGIGEHDNDLDKKKEEAAWAVRVPAVLRPPVGWSPPSLASAGSEGADWRSAVPAVPRWLALPWLAALSGLLLLLYLRLRSVCFLLGRAGLARL